MLLKHYTGHSYYLFLFQITAIFDFKMAALTDTVLIVFIRFLMPKNVGLHKGMVMIHGLRAELELIKEIWAAILNSKMADITDTF